MTIRSLPEVRQTLPGRSRPYRLFTREHCDFADFPARRTVVVDGWGVSYSHTYGEEGWELRAYRAPYTGEHHDLHGSYWAEQDYAKQAAFQAGLLAFMIYVDNQED